MTEIFGVFSINSKDKLELCFSSAGKKSLRLAKEVKNCFLQDLVV